MIGVVKDRGEDDDRDVVYRVGLEPDQVIEGLRKLPDVQAYTPDKMPDLGDLMPARRFVAEVDGDEFRICVGGAASQPGSVRGFDHGGGMFRRLFIRGRMRRTDLGTEVALRLEQGRTPRSMQRWVGFLVTGGCAVAWLFFGAAGTFNERMLLVAIFMGFTLPVVLYDLAKVLAARSQRLELYNLMEGLLGPEVLAEGERTPYRRRLPAG